MSEKSAQIRSSILARRKALPKEELSRLSALACRRLIAALPARGLGRARVALYSPLPGELEVAELEAWLVVHGARLHFPRIADRQARTMELVELTADRLAAGEGTEDTWELGPYGIREPKAHLPAARPDELDLILVPGLAYSPDGHRVGMGAGFYDRYLPGLRPDALRVALCFDFQLVPALEQEPWDQPVHWVLTENRESRAAPAIIQQALEKLNGP